MNQPKCARCSASMQRGFLFDRSHHDSGKAASWIEGAPERSFWGGTKTRGKARHPITAYRCERCGYVELYAREE